MFMTLQDQKQFKEPASLFEHFFVVGLHSYANVTVIEDAFAKKKAVDIRQDQYHGPIPTMEPQVWCFLEQEQFFCFRGICLCHPHPWMQQFPIEFYVL
jgi:hypothetical protein